MLPTYFKRICIGNHTRPLSNLLLGIPVSIAVIVAGVVVGMGCYLGSCLALRKFFFPIR